MTLKFRQYVKPVLLPLFLSGCASYPPFPAYPAQAGRAPINRSAPVGQARAMPVPREREAPEPVANQEKPAAPKLKKLPNGHYRVMQDWKVELGGRRWNVQKGYTSNGITAPDYIKSRLGDSVNSRDTWAAMFHDWLFTQPGVSRAEADRMYYQIMIAYGVPDSKAKLMFNTVSLYSQSKSQR